MAKDKPDTIDRLTIGIIGAGMMGGAFLGGLLNQGIVKPKHLLASDPRPERRAELEAQYGITTSADNREAAEWGNLVILAVKPQVLPSILPALRGSLRSEALCLSVVAGMPMQTLIDALEHVSVVRCIPNTPAQIGEGMTVWTATPEASDTQLANTRRVLGALGQDMYVENESYLDMATAINGSGPAYVFLMMEAMIDAGVHLGLTRPMAEQLVLQTMLGAVRYAKESGTHPALLRNAVTSPGGTTAAGLYELESGGLRATMSDAIWAAYRRSQELGKG